MLNVLDVGCVIALLHKLQTKQVNQAEEQLMSLSTNQSFHSCIHSILRSTDEEWVKTVAAAVLNRVICEQVGKSPAEQLSARVMEILLDSNIKQVDKRCFERSIISILEQSSEPIIIQWHEATCSMLTDPIQMDTAYLLIACAAIANMVDDYLFSLIQATFLPSLRVNVSVGNANLLNELFKMWTVVFDSLLTRSQSQSSIVGFLSSQQLMRLINEVLELQTSGDVFVCPNKELAELNHLKYEALQLLKRIMAYQQEHTFLNRLSVEFVIRIAPKMMRTLLLMVQHSSQIEQFLCQDLLITMISIFTIYVQDEEVKLTPQEAIAILEGMVFPFLGMTEEEMHLFEEEPEEYNTLAEDCCDKQLMGTRKTEVSKLLQKMEESLEGVLEYTVKRALQSLKEHMLFVAKKENMLASLPMDTALLILSISSYKLDRYPQEIAEIKIILCDFRAVDLKAHELARLFIFLGYNYTELFLTASDGEHLISFALHYTLHPTTVYCALDFISNVVDQYFTEEFLIKFLDRFLLGYNKGLIWSVCQKIVEKHFCRMSENAVMHFVGAVLQRAKLEITKLVARPQDPTLDLCNALSMLEQFLACIQMGMSLPNDSPIQDYTNILSQIWDVTAYMHQASLLSMEADMAKIVLAYALVRPDERVEKMLPSLIGNFKRNGYHEKVYFKLFNTLIMVWPLSKLDNVVMALKTAFITHIMELSAKKETIKLALSSTIILLQNFIALQGINMPVDFFYEISSLCVRLLPQQGNKPHKTIKARALNLLLLSHIHVKSDNTLEYLLHFSKQNIYHGYDTQVLVACLCREMCKETDIHTVKGLLSLAVLIVSTSEENQLLIHRMHSKKGGKQKIDRALHLLTELDAILKHLKTPFNQRTAKEELRAVMSLMRANNPQMYTALLNVLDQRTKGKLSQMVVAQVVQNKDRIIRKVVGIKSDPTEIHQEQSKRVLDEPEQLAEDEEGTYKRERMKKKAKAKRLR